MNDGWRREAKELGIKLWHRKKEDVIKEIEAKTIAKTEFIKITIDRHTAIRLCEEALKDYVIRKGLCEPVSSEKWFLNCKRKGIVFKGKAENDCNQQRETESGEGGPESDSVSQADGSCS